MEWANHIVLSLIGNSRVIGDMDIARSVPVIMKCWLESVQKGTGRKNCRQLIDATLKKFMYIRARRNGTVSNREKVLWILFVIKSFYVDRIISVYMNYCFMFINFFVCVWTIYMSAQGLFLMQCLGDNLVLVMKLRLPTNKEYTFLLGVLLALTI